MDYLLLLEQFLIVSLNQNQSNYSGQSQRTHSNPLSNQNSKQLHKARKNLHKQVTIDFGFASGLVEKAAWIF